MRMTKLLLLLIFFSLSSECRAQLKSEDELGLLLTAGNTNLRTFNAKTSNSYPWSDNVGHLSGSYVYGESEKIRSVEKWEALLKYERIFNEQFSGFVDEGIEANRFSGFRRRYNTDVGGKMIFIKSEFDNIFAELGYRYTVEKNINDAVADDKSSKARVYGEAFHKFSETVSGKLWAEYIPKLSETNDYLFNMGPSLAVVLSKVLSLKLAYQYNYINRPLAGKSKQDSTYTTNLMANF